MCLLDALDVDIVHEPDLVTVHLRGNGSNVYADAVRNELKAAVEHAGRVRLDLAELTFINSMLVGVLIEISLLLARAKVEHEIVAATDRVLEVLRRCRADHVLPLRDSA